MSVARKSQDQIPSNGYSPDEAERANAALRESGVDYRVEAGKPFDVKAFTSAALKRWSKVAARLAE